jgi:hypothetical protein
MISQAEGFEHGHQSYQYTLKLEAVTFNLRELVFWQKKEVD